MAYLNATYNNPGALGLAKWAQEKYGAAPSGKYDTGHSFAQFPTQEAGAAAQFDLWMRSPQFRGNTLKSAITNWIGPGEHGEAEYIANKLGIPLTTVITPEFLRSPQGIKLMQVQAEYEGANVISPDQWKTAQDWAYSNQPPGSTTTGKFLNPATGSYEPLTTTPGVTTTPGTTTPGTTTPGTTTPGVAGVDAGAADKIKEMNTLLALQKAQQQNEVTPSLTSTAGIQSLLSSIYKQGQQLNWWGAPRAQLVQPAVPTVQRATLVNPPTA